MVSVEDYDDSDDEKRRDSARKRKARAQDRDVKIRRCANRKRREAALADVYSFLDLYFGHRFYNPLTQMHRDIVQAILYRATHGGDQAIAAPRGEGKTTIAECVIIFCVLKGLLKFPLIVAATGPDAARILDNIKNEFEANELLAADFPEVCDPIIALEGGTSRQNMQTVSGERTRLKWSADFVVFPTVPKKYKSPCCGTVLMTRGIDSAIRGIRYRSQRPDMILGDDLETRDSAASAFQIETRKQSLLRDIGGLGGQGKKIATVIAGTNQNRICLMYQLSDPAIMPAFAGRRYKLLEKWPDNAQLREEYISKRQQAMSAGDPDATVANEYYLANREAIEASGAVCNPNRFIREAGEVSAIQYCFNFIADKGLEAFLTECQNDPPDPSEADGAQITQRIVASRISGLDHRELPAGIEKLVAFMDVGNNVCHFTETAWQAQEIGDITDYGTFDVRRTTDQKALELELLRVFHEWRIDLLHKYSIDGQTRQPDLVLIDSGDGHHTNAVYQFCREAGHPFYPSKGMSDSWTPPRICLLRGDHWAFVRQRDEAKTKLYEFNQLFWMQRLHQRFMTPTFDEAKAKEGIQERSAGSLAIYSCPDSAESLKKRREFTHQMVGEVWGLKKMNQMGRIVHGKNHFEDSTLGCCVAGNIVGSMILPTGKASRLDPKNRPTPQQMLRRA